MFKRGHIYFFDTVILPNGEEASLTDYQVKSSKVFDLSVYPEQMKDALVFSLPVGVKFKSLNIPNTAMYVDEVLTYRQLTFGEETLLVCNDNVRYELAGQGFYAMWLVQYSVAPEHMTPVEHFEWKGRACLGIS